MTRLADILSRDDVRQRLVDEMSRLVEEEVSQRRGVMGFTLRSGYRVVTAFGNDFVRRAVDELVESFIAELDPLLDEHGALEGFEEYLVANRQRVADRMLRVTDARRDACNNIPLRRAYDSLSPVARGSVERAVPRIGRLLQRYVNELSQSSCSAQPA